MIHVNFRLPSFSVIMKVFARRSLWNVQPKLKSQKKYCTFFAWNLISMPRGISWHHWKNLLTSKRGRSGGSNFSTEFDQIWLKTSGGSRELIFGPICKCLTISESSWHTAFRFWKLKDLGGHQRPPEAAENEKKGLHNFFRLSPMDPKS